MIAVTGAAFVFSTFPSAMQGSSFAFVSGDLTNTIRAGDEFALVGPDRKSTRLNSSHLVISYAVFCLKKIIHEFAVGRTLEATLEEIMHTIHAHPTLSEAALEATLAALGHAIHI